jgi:hypothetical protein
MPKISKSKLLSETVYVSRQFLRSVNLEADLGRSDALQGYVYQETAKSLLANMAHHIVKTRQRAFTWTGPYGGGKSSLALVLGSLVSPIKSLREEAKKILGVQSELEINEAWGCSKEGWLIIPVVGKRKGILESLSISLDKVLGKSSKKATSTNVILRLIDEAEKRKKDGVLLLIDELGKFLESAAQSGEDIYFYQELAEAASRCNGKLIIIGILHQSFEQYAIKLGRDARDEWAKIQGRYIDIPLVAGSDEVIELVGKALVKKDPPSLSKAKKFVAEVSDSIIKRRPNSPSSLKDGLLNCWPLHPVTAALLGPVSRKKFSQNERSIFGFLASAEPLGFADFLNTQQSHELSIYGPALYWDYLKANLEQAILASPDGHRWAAATDAIERAEAREGCTETHVKLTKIIALIDLFKSGSGLNAEPQILDISVENATQEEIGKCLQDLARWSVVVYRKHLNAWAIYSGSDFDIDAAVNEARKEIGYIDIKQLVELSELNPIVAKSEYHKTGTLRWFTRCLVQANLAEDYISKLLPRSGPAGEFILIAPNKELNQKQNRNLIEKLSNVPSLLPVVIGYAENSEKIYELGMELSALERVQKTYRELESDSVARKELIGRISVVKADLADELKNSFESSVWYQKGKLIRRDTRSTLSAIATKLAHEQYDKTPIIFNELVNRDSISGNATRARKDLMYQMLNNAGEKDLGFEGYPASAGLFHTIISENGLYQEKKGSYIFTVSQRDHFSGKSLAPLWEAADQLLKNSQEIISLSNLYDVWQAPPIGCRKGLLPIFALTYFLANRHELGLYIENTFIPELTEAYLDEWMQDTRRVAFRHTKIGAKRKEFLIALSTALSEKLGKPITANPLESARGLVNLIATLPGWTRRTTSVSQEAQELRRIILKANDPYKVLFTDLPVILKVKDEIDLVEKLSKLTEELQDAYPQLLNKFEKALYIALDHEGSLEKLRGRAHSVKGTSGDFGIDGFIARLTEYRGDKTELEGLLSIFISKKPSDWVDRDQEAAINQLADVCSKFRKVEANLTLRGKSASRKAFSFIYADPKNSSISKEFDVAIDRIPELKKFSQIILKDLKMQGLNSDEILAIFAEACSEVGIKE